MKGKIKAMLGNTVMVRAYSHCMMVAEFEGRLDSIDDPSCQVWARNGNLFFHTSQVTQFEKTDGLPAYIEVDWDRPITVASTQPNENNMRTMSNEQWAEEASIAYYESGAQYELDVCQEDWMERWLESKGRLGDGSPDPDAKTA